MLRIGIVCPYSLSLPGGVQGQVLGLAHTLRTMGHEARVLGPCDGPPPDRFVTALGKSVPAASNGSMAPIAPDPACALRTIHALRNEQFDVLHIHEPMVPGPSITSLVVADVPVVATFHAAGSRTHYASTRWATKRLARKIKARVAVSEDARSLAEATLGGEYEVLYNGIEVDRYASAVPAPKTSAKTVFFLGRHETRKGLGLLIDAMKVLPEDVELWVGGFGPQSASLKDATRDDPRIKWLGRMSEADKLSHLRSADVFCAPSIEGESFGIVLLEAMAAGTAVVASDIPGYRMVARDGQDAHLFASGIATSLADALQDVLGNEGLKTRLQQSGRARAESFSMTGLARRYEEIYLRLLTGR